MRALAALFLTSYCLAPAQSPPQGMARVEGQLVDAASGERVRKAWLTLRGAGPNQMGYTAVSDSTGFFAIDGIQPGRYSLTAEHAAYLRATIGGGQLNLLAGQTVKVGRTLLTPHAVISGRVLDEDGDPLPIGVQVQVSRWRWDPQTGQRVLTQLKQTPADDQGNFRLAGLPSGRYYLSAYGGRTTVAFDDRTVMPHAEAYTTTFYPGTSDPGSATAVPLVAGQELRDVNLRLRKTRTVRIRGTARDLSSGETVNQVALRLVPLSAYPTSPLTNDAVAVVQNGSFEFPRVQSGNYAIVSADATPGRSLGRYDLTVADGDLDGITVNLSPGAFIDCRIKMESNEPPQAAFQCGLRSTDATRLNPQSKPDAKDSPARIAGIVAGHYWVDYRGDNRSLPDTYVKAIHLGDADVTYKPIDVAGSAQPVLEFLISKNGGTVSGMVRDQKGEARAATQVVLAPVADNLGEITRLVKLSAADPQKGFRIAGVAPGDYLILAFENADVGALRDPLFRKAFAEKGVKVTVEEKSNLTLDVPLIPIAESDEQAGKLP